jgi:hypothetical protein
VGGRLLARARVPRFGVVLPRLSMGALAACAAASGSGSVVSASGRGGPVAAHPSGSVQPVSIYAGSGLGC